MQAQNRGVLIAGIVLILVGGCLLLLSLSNRVFGLLDIGFEIWRLWPMILILVGLAFFLPIILSWDNRRSVAGMALPGTIILANGLLLLYQSITGNWGSWAWAWTLEPIAVGLGMLLIYLLGDGDQGLLIGAGIVGGIGVVLMVIFGSLLGGPIIGILGPVILIAIGLLVLAAALLRLPRAR